MRSPALVRQNKGVSGWNCAVQSRSRDDSWAKLSDAVSASLGRIPPIPTQNRYYRFWLLSGLPASGLSYPMNGLQAFISLTYVIKSNTHTFFFFFKFKVFIISETFLPGLENTCSGPLPVRGKLSLPCSISLHKILSRSFPLLSVGILWRSCILWNLENNLLGRARELSF